MVKAEQLTALKGAVSPTDKVVEILCSQTKHAGYLFAVVQVKSDAFVACWENQALAFETLEQLACRAGEGSTLNIHEAELLRRREHVGAAA